MESTKALMACVDALDITDLTVKPDADVQAEVVQQAISMCSICLEESASLISLDCKHGFHRTCLEAQVEARSPTRRLTFGYLNCALCRVPMRRDAVNGLDAHFDLQERVHAVCSARASVDGAIEGFEWHARIRGLRGRHDP